MKPLKRLISVLNGVFNGSVLFTNGLSAFLLFFMVFVMVTHVTGRYFFTYPIPWAIEFSEYFLAIIVLMAAPMVLKEEGHVVIDVVTSRLSSRHKAVVTTFNYCIMSLMFLLITGWGIQVTYQHFLSGQTVWKTYLTPLWILDLFVPLACLLLLIQSVIYAHKYWKLARQASSEDK